MPFCLISRLNKSILSFRFSATQFVKIPLNTTKINKLYFYFKIYQKLYFISLISTKSCILHLIYLKNIFFEKNARTDACYFDKASCVYVGVHARAQVRKRILTHSSGDWESNQKHPTQVGNYKAFSAC